MLKLIPVVGAAVTLPFASTVNNGTCVLLPYVPALTPVAAKVAFVRLTFAVPSKDILSVLMSPETVKVLGLVSLSACATVAVPKLIPVWLMAVTIPWSFTVTTGVFWLLPYCPADNPLIDFNLPLNMTLAVPLNATPAAVTSPALFVPVFPSILKLRLFANWTAVWTVAFAKLIFLVVAEVRRPFASTVISAYCVPEEFP